jgi:galactose mutarotase-like enzyme
MTAVGDLLVLEDERVQSRVEIAPSRGGIVTSFEVAGRELLYMDPATLADPSKNIRGGIPVLFPSPGKLTNDKFSRDRKQGSMKQHGFARNLAWTPLKTSAHEAIVTLRLAANEQTRAQFPWEFSFDLTVSLINSRLTLALELDNIGQVPLPCAFGFHPYFALKNKLGASIDTRTSTVFDNVRKEVVPFAGFDFSRPEQDLYLLDHGSTDSALHYPDGATLAIRASSEFSRWVVWSLADKDYVCIEPWSAPADALNTGEGLIHVPPGVVRQAWVEFELS